MLLALRREFLSLVLVRMNIAYQDQETMTIIKLKILRHILLAQNQKKFITKTQDQGLMIVAIKLLKSLVGHI